MKIVILSLNYYPEDTAIGLYSTQMAEHLANNGWDLTVITGFPYYPQWKILASYQEKGTFLEEEINGIRVLRYKQFVPAKPTFIKRIIQIIDFTIGSLINLRKVKEADIIISIIPFTSSAWLGKRLAKRFKAKHWIHIQDFEFDAALETGVASGTRNVRNIAKVLNKIESNILNSANIVSTISHGMLSKLSEKSVSEQYYFPNWVDQDFINPETAEQHRLLNSSKFKVLYSGNIGAKQDWDFFLKVVKAFNNDNTLEFIIIGDGAMKNKFEIATKDFSNVFHYGPVPYKELNSLLCSADLHVLFQKEDVIDTMMPSKILGMMASQKPSLVTGNINSEVAKVFDQSGGGIFLEAINFEGVVTTIREFNSEPKTSLGTGKKARDYIVANFTKNKILEQFSAKLKSFSQ